MCDYSPIIQAAAFALYVGGPILLMCIGIGLMYGIVCKMSDYKF